MNRKYYRLCIRSGFLSTPEPYVAEAVVVHPKNIEIGENVTVGHNVILEAYHKNKMIIRDGVWIGTNCYFNSAGGLKIGNDVGIGPNVTILTSEHSGEPAIEPVMKTDLEFAPVYIQDGADIGAGSIILPGVIIGQGSIIGAGSVVTKGIHVPAYQVWAGNPAKFLRNRFVTNE